MDQAPRARAVEQVLAAQPTIEGAGVHLHRAFGQTQVPRLDPFLLLDDMSSENPLDYAAGFPWHPHRGMETVTYVLGGRVDHMDSMGNNGAVGPGDVQWMTAGSGIVHQEMPHQRTGGMRGFQLWINLPARHKMMDPRYQEIRAQQVPFVRTGDGAQVRVVAGRFGSVQGPVRDIVVDPTYLDVEVEAGASVSIDLDASHRAFAYSLDGNATFDEQRNERIGAGHLVIFEPGPRVDVRAGPGGSRFLLAAGRPIGEPVAWWGPIVMNDDRQIEQAVQEYQNGTFIRHRAAVATGAP